jgi:hypothetical protein
MVSLHGEWQGQTKTSVSLTLIAFTLAITITIPSGWNYEMPVD